MEAVRIELIILNGFIAVTDFGVDKLLKIPIYLFTMDIRDEKI